MKRALLLAAILLAVTAGITVWAYNHQGYPYAVYYRRVEFPISSGTLVMQEWIDPERQLIRRQQEWLGSSGTLLLQHGRVYSLGLGASQSAAPVSPAVQRGLMYIFQGLKSSGFGGIGRQLLLHRLGPVTRLYDGSRALLCFDADGFDSDALSEVVCIDARTFILVHAQLNLNHGSVLDAVYTQNTLFPAYALPGDFFELPYGQDSLWARVLRRLQDFMGVRAV